jgi:1-acyl-sn-glycerol-3-phosphate acyltransferase
MLPQWALDLAHPATHFISKSLWGMRLRGEEHIPAPEEGGLIIAANHQTYVDPFWISIPIKRPIRYLAWSEAFKWPLLGRMMELFGAWPLQVEGSDPAAIRRSLQWLREGGAVVIFPEGERARADGEMGKFKAGAARMALEANVPVLPVTIRGAHRVWPRGRRLPRLNQIEIIYHPPRRLTPLPGEDTRRCARREIEQLAAVIKSAL